MLVRSVWMSWVQVAFRLLSIQIWSLLELPGLEQTWVTAAQIRANDLGLMLIVGHESFVEHDGIFFGGGHLIFKLCKYYIFRNIQTTYKFYRVKSILYSPISHPARIICN